MIRKRLIKFTSTETANRKKTHKLANGLSAHSGIRAGGKGLFDVETQQPERYGGWMTGN